MAEPVIELQGVRLTYDDGQGRVRALQDVSFRVGSGERVAIIGPSGSGKTSLMRVLGGLETADAGAVHVSGRDLGDVDRVRDAAADVGHIFQEFGLVSELSALQNVCCGRLYEHDSMRTLLSFNRRERRRAARILQNLGLGDRVHQRTSKLSGGEKQRVGIARLLSQAPGLVLMDEPVSNLDIHWAEEAMDQLGDLREGDATIVGVFHDLSMVRRWADRVLLMRDGEIVYDGSPDEACRRLEEFDAAARFGRSAAPDDESGDTPRFEAGVDELLERPVVARRVFYVAVLLALVVGWIWSVTGMGISISQIFGGLGGASSFVGRLFPPDLSVAPTVFDSLLETIQMALVGTTLASVVSLPLAVLAARNVSPIPVRGVARVVLVVLRTIPSIIWGLFFVAMVGLGPLPGILALTFYAAGYLGKFYYEGIESIATEPVYALRTMGANRVQQFRHGVFPQVLPLLVGYTLYMFEYNVRAASILGIVGAGGIGFYLYTYINNFEYPKATTALAMLVVVVIVIDVTSSQIRKFLQE